MLYILIGIIILIGLGFLFVKFSKSEAALMKSVVAQQNLKVKPKDPAFLASMLQTQDEQADTLIKQLFDSGNPDEINGFYTGIHRNSAKLPDTVPSYIREYFDNTNKMPDWADPVLIKKGEDFYIQHGGMIALILCVKSLPECYACGTGAKVLYETGQMSAQNGSLHPFSRRIAETSEFIIKVMSPGALGPNGHGIVAPQKVRLIHATIRYYLNKRGWDSNKFGMPVNQLDMAGTLLSFAPVIIQGLELFGVEVSEAEKEAYIHCWKIVGHFMGLHPELLPQNYADALAIGETIFNSQKAESMEGKELTLTLLKFLKKLSFNGEMDLIAEDMIRMMVGNEIADMLGIPKPTAHTDKLTENFITLFGGWENIEKRSLILRSLSKPINTLFLNGMLKYLNEGEGIHFFLPPNLQPKGNAN